MGFYSDVTVWSKKGVPKLTSLRLLSLLKNAIWSSKKGHPHKLPNSNIKAVMVLTNVGCSSIFYASVSAANTWWHPNHTSKEEEKHKGKEKKKIQANILKTTKIYRYLLDQGLVTKRCSQIDQFVTTFFVKKCHLEFKEGSPPQVATFNYQGSQSINKCMIFIHILCIGFCSWCLMAPTEEDTRKQWYINCINIF